MLTEKNTRNLVEQIERSLSRSVLTLTTHVKNIYSFLIRKRKTYTIVVMCNLIPKQH